MPKPQRDSQDFVKNSKGRDKERRKPKALWKSGNLSDNKIELNSNRSHQR
jgi:hypothetical protein